MNFRKKNLLEKMVRQMSSTAASLALLQNLDPDKVLENFGKYGRYQLSVYMMATICFIIFSYITTITSLIGEPPAICEFENGVANYTDGLDENGYSTLASDFNISCADKNMLNHVSGAFMIGNFFCTPLSAYLADRYGRRMIFLVPLWICILLSIACSFAPNFQLFLVFRFLSGACGAAISVIGFVLMVESVSGPFRSIQALINAFIWVLGIFAVGILHLFITNWRYLYLCIAAPGILSIFYYWTFPESLHWLIANKKTKEVHRYIAKSSKMNKITLDLQICQLEASQEENANNEGEIIAMAPPVNKRSFIDILRAPSLLFNLFLNCYVYVVLNFVYWVLTLYSVDMHENKMVGFFLSAAVEVPAGLIAMLLLFLFGRRTVTIISLLGQTISIGMTIFTPQGSTLNLILSLFAKILNTVAWASAPLLMSEMAPTTVRNMCIGLVSTAGEIGSVFAPYLKWIGDENTQKAVITSMSFLAILFSLTLPETNGKPLPQDLDDFDSGPFIRALGKFRKTKPENDEKKGQRNCSKKYDNNNEVGRKRNESGNWLKEEEEKN